MSLTQEKAEKLIEELRSKTNDYISKQDSAGIASLYHPNAVLIHDAEEKPVVGRDAIQKVYEKYLSVKPEFVDKTVYVAYSADGKYLISHGEYEIIGDSPFASKNSYERIYKQDENRQYLLYYKRQWRI